MDSSLFRPVFLALTGLIFLSNCSEGPVRRTYTESPAEQKRESKSELLKKAQSFYANGEFGNALSTLGLIDDGKLTAEEKTEHWNLKGLIRLSEKNYPAAITDFRKAVASNPVKEFAGYYEFNLASAWADSGHPDEAKKILDRIDSKNMAEPDQKKVAALKEKLARKATLATSGALSGPSNTSEIEPFQGPVKEKRIGQLLPLSGKYENFGKKVQRSVELAFQNSTDPSAKTYELIPVDGGETPEAQAEGLKKLVEEDQVIAVIGPILAKSLDALAPKAEYYQVPLISLAQVQGKPSPHLFSCSVSVKDQVSKVVDFAMNQKNYKRFAILAPDNKSGSEMAQSFWDEVDSRKGEVRGFEMYDPDLTDFREPVDKILGLFYTETRSQELKELADKRKELNITKKTMKTIQYFTLPPIRDFDAVFIADEAKTVGQIIPTFAYRDAKNVSFLGISSWNSNQLIQRAGDQAEGAVFPVAFNTQSPPDETKRFTELYSHTYNANPGELDAVAFDAAALVIKTLAKTPSTREEFRQLLATQNPVEGATGPVSIQDQRCTRTLSLFEVEKGSFRVQSPSAATPQ